MSAAFVREVLQPGGMLSRVLEGYEARPSQLRMGEAVLESFAAPEHLLVEAPPGTGKTFAYLVPSVASGRTVVISTGTRTLQDQLFQRDIPTLSRVIGRKIRAALMKGRENYLCLHRLEELTGQRVLSGLGGSPAAEADRLERVRRWSGQTATGDRAELSGLPEPWHLWERIDARADTCLGQRCPLYDPCFLTRMRRAAQEADLIVVNHHLLLSDLVLKASAYGSVIPPYGLLVIDEAHMLEEVATSHLGRGVSSYQIRELLSDASSTLEASEWATEEEKRALSERTRQVKESAADFYPLFESRDGRFLLDPLRSDPAWRDRGTALASALEETGRTLGELAHPSDVTETLRRRALDLSVTLGFLVAGEDEEKVMWGERRGRGTYLMASPIDVSKPLRELLFESVQGTVLTSSTLTVDGTFDYVRSRVGPEQAATLSLTSPFDVQSQAVLYLPRKMPEPGSPEFPEAVHREITGLLEITDGRAFVLFTSFAAMRRTREALQERIPYPVLMQGEASRHLLLESFRATPHAVLLATSSFWQGVDVPGEALSLVVIEKLPFDVPTDPLVAARCEAVRRRGGNPFHEYQIPSAVIDLKQGLGRLLRSSTDRGVLSILDGRLRTKGYGGVFLRSLPPYRVVDTQEAVRAFFRGSGDGGGGRDAPETPGAPGTESPATGGSRRVRQGAGGAP